MNSRTAKILLIVLMLIAAPAICMAADDAKAAPAEDTALTLDEGEITVLVPKQDKANEFKVQTPTAVLAVRGTEFNAKVGDDGKTEVHVLDGAVAALNDIGEVLLEQGMASEILKGILPESFNFDVGEFRKVLDLWQGGITKGKVRDFVKAKVKEEVKKEVKKNLGF